MAGALETKRMAQLRGPYLPLFTGDWRAASELEQCSLAARGLWIELMAIMHESPAYGHLLRANGDPYHTQDLVMAVRAPLDEIEDCLAILEHEKAFSRTKDGVIFCRRMVRDYDRLLKHRANGTRGSLARYGSQKRSDVTSESGDSQKPPAPKAKPAKPKTPTIHGEALALGTSWNEESNKRGLGTDDTACPSGQGMKNVAKRIAAGLTWEQAKRCQARYWQTFDLEGKSKRVNFANFWGEQARFEAYVADDWQPPKPASMSGNGTARADMVPAHRRAPEGRGLRPEDFDDI